MTGVVPYKQLADPAPIAVAIDRMNPTWAIVPYGGNAAGQLNLVALAIKVGAFTGLSSVMLVLTYAQTRIFYTMARDGLLPRVFAVVHPRFRTPWIGTILLGGSIAVGLGLPADRRAERLGFARYGARLFHRLPVGDLPAPPPTRICTDRSGCRAAYRPQAVGIVFCLALAGFNLLPMVQKALGGEPAAAGDHRRLLPGGRGDLRRLRLPQLAPGPGPGHPGHRSRPQRGAGAWTRRRAEPLRPRHMSGRT